jgi:hypothetical protein
VVGGTYFCTFTPRFYRELCDDVSSNKLAVVSEAFANLFNLQCADFCQFWPRTAGINAD